MVEDRRRTLVDDAHGSQRLAMADEAASEDSVKGRRQIMAY